MRFMRTLALAGGGGLAFLGIVIVSGPLWQPGFNGLRQYGSELALGPNGWLMTTAFVLGGLGTWLLVASLWLALAPSRPRDAGVALLGVSGLGFVASAIVQTGSHRPGPHEFIGLALFVSLLLALPILASAASRQAWLASVARPGRWAALASFAVLVVSFAFASPGGDAPARPLDAYAGLLQKLFIAPWLTWLVAVAYRIARHVPAGAALRDEPA